MAKVVQVDPRSWQAKDVDELRAVWDGLRLDSDDPLTERRFFGRLLSAEEAGNTFERWIMEAFRLSGAMGDYAFTVPLSQSGATREEIDGLIIDELRGYLVESKFWTGKVDFSPVALLHALLDRRPDGTMGLFFSAFGYTTPGLESVWLLRPMRVLLFNATDLLWALPPRTLAKQKASNYFGGRMIGMVRQKWLCGLRDGVPSSEIETTPQPFNQKEGWR